MCGIFGVYDFKASPDFEKSKFAIDKIKYRGPDFQNTVRISDHVIFSHARLSIIDLSEVSNQPLYSKDRRYSIIFNGEIFNYIELRQELIDKGVEFATDGDTEVLLQCYINYGLEFLNKLNGMWAFAIYDKKEDVLICARDRYGIKPFMFSYTEDRLIFASECKALLAYDDALRVPNYESIANFIRKSYGAQGISTWFTGISRLLPGQYLMIKNKTKTISTYYKPKISKSLLNYNDAKEKYKNLFLESVKLRMRSDVLVGTTLSSGIDSSSIVAAIRNLFGNINHKTFTAYFHNNTASKSIYKNITMINEEVIVKKLSSDLSLDSEYILCGDEINLEELGNIVYHLEAGNFSPAIIPVDIVYKEASKKVKVVLEGQGADEILGGYITMVVFDYFFALILRGKFVKAFRFLGAYRKEYNLSLALILFVRTNFPKSILKYYYKFSIYNNVLGFKLRKQKYLDDSPIHPPKGQNVLSKKLFYSLNGILVDLLHYGDRLSMRYSIESRHPFLDHNFVEFCQSLPPEYLLDNGIGKLIHRESLEKIVPEYIFNNKNKFGFNTPFNYMFDKNSPKNCLDFIINNIDEKIFNKKEIIKLLDKNQLDFKHSRLIFRILLTILWFKKFELEG